MTEQELRDCFAMFAMLRLDDPVKCYEMADAMLEARKPKNVVGLPAIKRKTSK